MLTPREAAQILGVSGRTLSRMVGRGDIEARRLPSGHRRFVRAEVEALIALEAS